MADKSQNQTGSFATCLKRLQGNFFDGKRNKVVANEPFSSLSYAKEVELKNQAFAAFWRGKSLPGMPKSLVQAPKPRGYRTTSQRQAHRGKNSFALTFGDAKGIRTDRVEKSSLEPPEHAALYSFCHTFFSQREHRSTAQHLNFLIIRGDYEQFIVICNVDCMNGPLVRSFKILSGRIQKNFPQVGGMYLYHDPSRSKYYLDSKKKNISVPFKKLFGPPAISVKHLGTRYLFHPTSFSQVNHAMVPVILQEAERLLRPFSATRLLDLYCGYGLFSCFLGKLFQDVYGVEGDSLAVQYAKKNAALNRIGKVSFRVHRITAAIIERSLPKIQSDEVLLIDPPRQGPEPGVIEALCRRRPRAVLHIFCGVDEIPTGLAEWQKGGYKVREIVPLDMFAGTSNLEVLILLVPKSS